MRLVCLRFSISVIHSIDHYTEQYRQYTITGKKQCPGCKGGIINGLYRETGLIVFYLLQLIIDQTIKADISHE